MEDEKTLPVKVLLASGLGRGPRMHINALSGSSQVNKAERPEEGPGNIGHR